MKNIAIITATRAEYGLLKPVIEKLRNYEQTDFKVSLVVTGTHLSESYGLTINEIIRDNIRIDHTLEICLDCTSSFDITNNQADVLCKFAALFSEHKFDGIVILGDRYEMLAIAIAASNAHIPIFHLCGGDTTEGAIDEWIRHSITKMSYLHFVTNEDSQFRVIQLGESPDRVFNYGSTSIDNITKLNLYDKQEALESIGLDDCEFALCTYHPVTMEDVNVDDQIKALIEAMKLNSDIEFIITKSNSDAGGAKINELWDFYDEHIENIHVYSSLGILRYLSLMKHCAFVIGNSSSGIIETPAFYVPTVNIGDRQKGRLRSDSIIDCAETTESILKAIDTVRDKDFLSRIKSSVCKYGDGNASERIAETIYTTVINEEIDLKKQFYNIRTK